MGNYYERSISAEQQNRKNRAKYENMVVHDIDYAKKTAIIESSDGTSFYSVSLYSCTCPDFLKRGMTCKHMYKLQNVLQQSHTDSSSARNSTSKTNEQKLKTSVTLLDRPDINYIIIAVIIFIIALFLFDSSVFAGIIFCLFGIYLIYRYIDFKRHPNSSKYFSEQQLEHWAQLVFSSEKTVYELQKASLPILLELKQRAQNYYNQLSSSITDDDIQTCSKLLIATQQQIIELSEFIVIKGDNPQSDYEKYCTLIKQVNAAHSDSE